MDVDRETVVELVLSAVAFFVFVGAVYVVSTRYAAPPNGAVNDTVPPVLDPQGGLVVVGVIGLFVLVMGVAGLWMYRMDFDGE